MVYFQTHMQTYTRLKTLQRTSLNRLCLSFTLILVMIFCNSCGLLLDDPHPYPDMGAGEEVNTTMMNEQNTIPEAIESPSSSEEQ